MIAPEGVLVETFRDPAGSLRISEESVLRKVSPEFARQTLRFLQSGLAKRWVTEGRMVTTSVLESCEGAPLQLEHPRVFFPSYPWEWAPGQWLAAAGLTLDLCEEALADGLILKDATPLNILFSGHRPVFVDILSFEPRDPKSALWPAYGQFVRTFLLPLAAHKYLGWPLAASVQRRDGYEPADLYPHLWPWQRWAYPLRSIVTLPYLMGKKRHIRLPKFEPPREVTLSVLQRTIRSLRKLLQAVRPQTGISRWSKYVETANHYTAEDHASKRQFVLRALALAAPRQVLDLGGNTGVYSRIAAESGANVVSWDTDSISVERSWQEALKASYPILPLVADVARPTPSIGWRNHESQSLLERAAGRFDCVMALGLTHHLLVMDQIPLDAIIGLIRDLTRRWAIVECIPSTDSQFVELCRGRENLYGNFDEERLLEAARRVFRCRMQERLPNGRTIFLFEATA